MTPDRFLGDAARKLAEPDHADTLRGLRLFVDMWGLDAYTPPPEIEARVRECIKGMVVAADMQRRERS